MKKTIIAASALALSLGVLAAPVANASERETYAYAASHMPTSKDIPKALGTYRPSIFFSASPFDSSIYLCDLKGDSVTVKGAKYAFNAGYRNAKRNDPGYVSVNVWQFKNSQQAIKTYDALKKNIKKCTGSDSQTFTDDDGSSSSYTHNLTNGTVPSVTVVGVESVFVNSDYTFTSSEPGGNSKSDNYSVYTLVNDVIISSSYYNSVSATLSPAQRKAANQLAFNAVGIWVD